jgi:hypothetical protein
MKILVFIFLIASFNFASDAETMRLSKALETNAVSETFGALLDKDLPKVELAALSAAPAEYLGTRFSFSVRVNS